MLIKMPVVLETDLVEEIAEIGRRRLPNEACGVLIPPPGYRGKQVFELPNRSPRPADSFLLSSEDLVLVLEDWARKLDPSVWGEITLWHTHPSGAAGPSRADLHNRIEHCGNLIIALPAGGKALPTWF